MAPDQNWLTTLGLVTSSLIAVTANSLLLLVFFRRRGLRTVSNRFVINLLVTNLLSSVFLVPLLIVDQQETSGAEGVVERYLNISTEISVEDASPLLETNNRTTTAFAQKNGNGALFIAEEREEEIGGDGRRAFVENDEIIYGGNSVEEILKINYKQAAKSNATDRGFLGNFLCYFAQSTTNLICTTSIFSILLIGIDQYFAVVHPLRYHSYMNKCRSTLLLASCWLFSMVLAVVGTSVSADANFWQFCKKPLPNRQQDDPSVSRVVYSFSYFTLVILLPFVTICVIYVCIYTAAHKNSERMRKSTSANSTANFNSYAQLPLQVAKDSSEETLNGGGDGVGEEEEAGLHKTLPKVRSAPNFINLENLAAENVNGTNLRAAKTPKVARSSSDRASKNIIVSLRSRISNASVFKYREETRAAKISILVIFMVLICYTPYGLAVLLNTDLYSAKIPRCFNYLSLILLVVSNIASPFLFAYRNRRIQRELCKFLRLIPPKSADASLRRSALMHRSSFCGGPHRTGGAVGGTKGEKRDEDETVDNAGMPFLGEGDDAVQIPKVVVECKVENEKKSILKRVCSKNWSNYKKCNFITVPDSCLDTRGSFSSASTQISTEE